MPQVQLANVYTPLVFNRTVQEKQTRLNAFIASGVAVQDPTVTELLSGGSRIIEFPQFMALATGEPNYSNDNPANLSVPKGMGSQTTRARAVFMNESWAAMRLARELSDVDPVGAITDRVAQYWATVYQDRMIASSLGVLNDNIANDAGDMLRNIATDAVGVVTDAERISANAILLAKQTLGDAAKSLQFLVVHSVIMTRLQMQNLITFIPASDGNVAFTTYLGYRIIADDSMPAVAGTNRITYTSMLCGPGVFGIADAPNMTPSEVKADPNAGNGGGMDTLFSRENKVIHPYGFDFVGSSIAGASATNAELLIAANWDRKQQRKNVALAFLRTND